MNGGWYSFSGETGKGGWGRSLFHEVLPVECIVGDDLIESTASFPVRMTAAGHPLFEAVNLEAVPPLLGFNETHLRPGAIALADIQHQGQWYPLLAMQDFGQGKASVWTTGASPHWGINLVKWPEYDALWQGVFTRL